MLTVYNSCKHFTYINFTHNNALDIVILSLYMESKAQRGYRELT